MAGAESECFGSDAFLVSRSGARTGFEKNANDVEMTVGCGKVERGGALCAGPAGGAFCLETSSVDVGAVQDEHAHALLAATRAGSVQWQDAIQVAVGGLTILEGKLDKTDVAGGSSAVQTQVGMHALGMAGGAAEAALSDGLEGGAANSAPKHVVVVEPSAAGLASGWLADARRKELGERPRGAL